MEKSVEFLSEKSYKEFQDILFKKRCHLNKLEKEANREHGKQLAEQIEGEILDIEGVEKYQIIVSRNPETGSTELNLHLGIPDWYVKEHGEWRESQLEGRDGHYYLRLYGSDIQEKVEDLLGEEFERVMLLDRIDEENGRKEIIKQEGVE